MPLLLLFLFCVSLSNSQNTIYVNYASKNNGDGKSWSTAFTDLQSALKVATGQASIWIAQGTYYPTSTTNRNTTFLINIGINMYGGFKGTETSINQRPNPLAPTILSGNIGDKSISTDNSYHVIKFTTDHGTMDGLIITDGYSTDDTHSGYIGCDTCFGGGIFIPCDQRHPVKLNINQCTFENNTALSGGAIFGMCQPGLSITNSIFNNNKAIFGTYKGGYGGAFMFAYMGDITISNTTFSNNIADGGGGAVHCDYGMDCTFKECIFEGNIVNKGNGAAISVIDRDSQRGFSNLMVTQSTFTNNKAIGTNKNAAFGGAIYLFDNDCHGIVNTSKFTHNTANMGGAMSFYGESHCPGCCAPKSGNTFNGNTANNQQYNDCYISDGFITYKSAPVTSDPLIYLAMLYAQKDAIQPQNVPPPSDNIVYVNKIAKSGGDGTSWSNAFNMLQNGLDSAENILKKNPKTTVEIWVTGSADYNINKYIPSKVPNWYNFSAPYYDAQKSKMFEIAENINVFGGFSGRETKRDDRDWYKNPTLLDAYVSSSEQVYQVVYVRENVWIDGFMIANAYAFPGPPPKYDSDVYNLRATNPNQILTDPTPVRGAGIFSNVTVFTPVNILFYSHYSTKGSGLYVLGNPNFTHNITGYNLGFVNNYAIDRGGGIGIDLYGEMNCIGCILMNNLCSHKGGAVYSDFWSHNVFDTCVFYNNTALDSGGGIGMDAGYSKVINSNFTANTAFSQGAAMYTGSYNPWGGGDNQLPNHYILGNNVYSDNICYSGLDDHYLWTYDYWIDAKLDKMHH